MRFHHIIFLFAIFCAFSAHAYELIMIQAVSDTKKTFLTRNGKRQGIIQGMTGTFTAEDVSILAKAITVTGQYTQWEIINENATLPFEKGTIVTYYPANEYIWALNTEAERQKYIKSQIPTARQSIVVKGAISRGISESTTDSPATNYERGGYVGEIYYERDIAFNFAFDVGIRYDKEVVNYDVSSAVTTRALLIADLLYYYDARRYIDARLYGGIGAGYGESYTETMGVKQSGTVGLLPTVKLGAALPFNTDWEFLLDFAFDSMQTKEEQQGGRELTTTQTNFKSSIGLRHFF